MHVCINFGCARRSFITRGTIVKMNVLHKDITKRIYKDAKDVWLMQVATSTDNQPWIANVFFVLDTKMNFYWLSVPYRRHSRELSHNNKAAIAVAIKTTKPVIGLQAEGTVEIVNDIALIEKILPEYSKKYKQGKEFIALAKKGKNKHMVYKFTPELLQLFDEANYTLEQNPITLFFEE